MESSLSEESGKGQRTVKQYNDGEPATDSLIISHVSGVFVQKRELTRLFIFGPDESVRPAIWPNAFPLETMAVFFSI